MTRFIQASCDFAAPALAHRRHARDGPRGGRADALPHRRIAPAARSARGAGWGILRAGGSAPEAVEAAVRVLEDDLDKFNAGTGATRSPPPETWSSTPRSWTARPSAAARRRSKDVRNLIALARAVMERSHHVPLAGPGASAFAREVGIPRTTTRSS